MEEWKKRALDAYLSSYIVQQVCLREKQEVSPSPRTWTLINKPILFLLVNAHALNTFHFKPLDDSFPGKLTANAYNIQTVGPVEG